MLGPTESNGRLALLATGRLLTLVCSVTCGFGILFLTSVMMLALNAALSILTLRLCSRWVRHVSALILPKSCLGRRRRQRCTLTSLLAILIRLITTHAFLL